MNKIHIKQTVFIKASARGEIYWSSKSLWLSRMKESYMKTADNTALKELMSQKLYLITVSRGQIYQSNMIQRSFRKELPDEMTASRTVIRTKQNESYQGVSSVKTWTVSTCCISKDLSHKEIWAKFVFVFLLSYIKNILSYLQNFCEYERQKFSIISTPDASLKGWANESFQWWQIIWQFST